MAGRGALTYRYRSNTQEYLMKSLSLPILVAVSALTLLSGCAWHVGDGEKHASIQPTIGQQLIDLQKAKDAGAITDSEYQVQKTKLLGR